MSQDLNKQSDTQKEIDILLSEFAVLRAESSSLAHSEDSLITTTFSFIAAIIGLNFFFGEGAQENLLNTTIQISEDSSKCMILCVCPLLVMFFGCMWMNILYRRIRFGAYLYLIEMDINKYVSQNSLKVYWEHWIIGIECGRGFFRKTSHFYGYIVFGTWLIAPILLYFSAFSLFPQWTSSSILSSVLEYFSQHKAWAWFLGLMFMIYIMFMLFFCVEVLELRDPRKLNSIDRVGE